MSIHPEVNAYIQNVGLSLLPFIFVRIWAQPAFNLLQRFAHPRMALCFIPQLVYSLKGWLCEAKIDAYKFVVIISKDEFGKPQKVLERFVFEVCRVVS